MLKFVPASVEYERLQHYENLFSSCFPGVKKFSHKLITWLYSENPDGQVVGYDAFDGDRLAAHYACIPTTAKIDGVVVKALLSLNTATHPDFQGKGLFPKLAERTYEAGAHLGFHSVHGVANANSTPSFIRKLGFQLVQPLDASIGVGRLGVDLRNASAEAQFERVWTPESLKWRCSNPANKVYVSSTKDGVCLHASAIGRVVSAVAELPSCNALDIASKPTHIMRLNIGLAPASSKRAALFAPIPARLRPSPLNMIYRPLVGNQLQLDKDSIHFTFLDFDAY